MNNNLVAVIPAKSNSSRVPNKNFRDFYNGESLLEIKIKQLTAAGIFSSIYVSSDSPEAKEIAEKCEVTFIERDPYLCLDSTPWGEVLIGVMKSLPIDDSCMVAWSMPTSPLFSRFKEFWEFFKTNSSHDSAVTVTKLSHYYLNSDFIPINHQWGPWHSYSQGIKPIYHLNLACFITQKIQIIQNQYLIGNRPCFYSINQIESFDIDTLEEFENAQYFYQRMIRKAK